jgi:hypothetical protein
VIQETGYTEIVLRGPAQREPQVIPILVEGPDGELQQVSEMVIRTDPNATRPVRIRMIDDDGEIDVTDLFMAGHPSMIPEAAFHRLTEQLLGRR